MEKKKVKTSLLTAHANLTYFKLDFLECVLVSKIMLKHTTRVKLEIELKKNGGINSGYIGKLCIYVFV